MILKKDVCFCFFKKIRSFLYIGRFVSFLRKKCNLQNSMSALNNTFEEINRVISGVDTYIDFNTGYVNFQGLLYLDSNNNNIGVNNTNPEEAVDISGNMRVGGYINQVVRNVGAPSLGKFPNSGDGGFYQDIDNNLIYLCFNETGNLIVNKFSNQSFDQLTNTFEEIDRVISGVDSFSMEFDAIDNALLSVDNLNTPLSVIDSEMDGLIGLAASYEDIDYAATGIASLAVTFEEINDAATFTSQLSVTAYEINDVITPFGLITSNVLDIENATTGFNSINANTTQIEYAATGFSNINSTPEEIEKAVTGFNAVSYSPEEIENIIAGYDSINLTNEEIKASIEGVDGFLNFGTNMDVDIRSVFNYGLYSSGDTEVENLLVSGTINQIITGDDNPSALDFPITNDWGLYKNNNTSDIFHCYNDGGELYTDLVNVNKRSTDTIQFKDDFMGFGSMTCAGEKNWNFVNMLGTGILTPSFQPARMGVAELISSTGVNDSSSIFLGGGAGVMDYEFVSQTRSFEAEFLFKIETGHEYYIGISNIPTGSAPNLDGFVGLHYSGSLNWNFLQDNGNPLDKISIDTNELADQSFHKLTIKNNSSGDWELSLDDDEFIMEEMENILLQNTPMTFSIQQKTIGANEARSFIDAFSLYAIR